MVRISILFVCCFINIFAREWTSLKKREEEKALRKSLPAIGVASAEWTLRDDASGVNTTYAFRWDPLREIRKETYTAKITITKNETTTTIPVSRKAIRDMARGRCSILFYKEAEARAKKFSSSTIRKKLFPGAYKDALAIDAMLSLDRAINSKLARIHGSLYNVNIREFERESGIPFTTSNFIKTRETPSFEDLADQSFRIWFRIESTVEKINRKPKEFEKAYRGIKPQELPKEILID